MSDRPVIKQDLDRLETKLEQRFGNVEQRLDNVEQRLDNVEQRLDNVEQRLDSVEQRLGGVESKLEIVAQQVAWLTRESVTRADLAALREELGRDIARHVEAGFKMMRDQFGLQDDRATAIEGHAAKLRADFTAHTSDFVLHNKP